MLGQRCIENWRISPESVAEMVTDVIYGALPTQICSPPIILGSCSGNELPPLESGSPYLILGNAVLSRRMTLFLFLGGIVVFR